VSDGESTDDGSADADDGAETVSTEERSTATESAPTTGAQSPPGSESATESESGAESDSSGSGDESAAPTQQSAALRRQQFYVGAFGVILGGLAVAVILLQRFPDAPALLPVLGGLVGAGIVFWLVRRSLFPAEQTVSGEDAD
jgi:hypothetical protein